MKPDSVLSKPKKDLKNDVLPEPLLLPKTINLYYLENLNLNGI